MKGKIYGELNVYDAAIRRIHYVFDKCDKVVLSLSGGKDSVSLFHLTAEVAAQVGRKFYCFFLDQEMEYDSTFAIVEELMKHPLVIPLWFQIHGILPTAISHEEYWLEPWAPSKRDLWIRSQKQISIKKITWPHSVPWSFPDEEKMGFYGLMKTMEQMFADDNVGHLIGLRAEESLNRFRAVTKHEGIKGVPWCTRTKNGNVKFYPIYDWTFQDVWVYIGRNNLAYNKMYDYFYKSGVSPNSMRISSLMNRKAFQCLVDLQAYEPKLYDKLLLRAKGVHTATIYAHESKIFKAKKLPENFNTWRKYRDFLLLTLPNREHASIFEKRFKTQRENEYVHKQQVYQIQITDITNSKKIDNSEDPEIAKRELWMKMF